MWAALDEDGRSPWIKKNEELVRAEKDAEREAAANAAYYASISSQNQI